MTDGPEPGEHEHTSEGSELSETGDDGAVVDGSWAVLLATDDESAAEAVHRRLRAGNVDAHIRDVDEADRGEDDPSIQVIVPVEEVPAALAELQLQSGIIGAQSDAGQVDRVESLGYEIDDLAIAELTATGGPEYALDDIGDDQEISVFLDILEAERIRFSLDRNANVVVHYNDEAKVDELIDRFFDDDSYDDEDYDDSHRSDDQDAVDETAAALEDDDLRDDVLQDVDDPMVVVVGRPAPVVGPTAAVSDVEGRPAVDDVTPDQTAIISQSRSPVTYLAAGAVVAILIVLLIVLVL